MRELFWNQCLRELRQHAPLIVLWWAVLLFLLARGLRVADTVFTESGYQFTSGGLSGMGLLLAGLLIAVLMGSADSSWALRILSPTIAVFCTRGRFRPSPFGQPRWWYCWEWWWGRWPGFR